MTEKLQSLITFLPLMYFLILVHECGHLCFGRISGIPSTKISIKLFSFTPYVVLKDKENNQISPKEIEQYIDVLNDYFRTDKQYFLFVCGGHLFELITVLIIFIISFILLGSTVSSLLIKIIPLSLYLSLVYLIVDLVLSKLKRTTFGDFSSLFSINRKYSLIFYLGYFMVLAFINMLVYRV